jgi:hypothetical protein
VNERISGNTSCRIALLALCAAGCKEGFSPPKFAERFDPPASYNDFWTQVQDCSGLSGDSARVHWYVVRGTVTFPCSYGDCRGLWVAPHDIYLSDAAAADIFFENFFTVKHEILHDLVGQGGHPPVFQQCGLLRTDSLG